jgi:peptidoglycan/LPS O-acetylase OafA/YrhL
MKTPNEIRSLTGLRGVAAVYVVLYHFITPLPFTNFLNTFESHGYLAVDLFFVLSGFVMAMNYGHMFQDGWSFASYRRFLGRRVARIYPLYLVVTIVGFIELFHHHRAYAQAFEILAANVLMIQTWGLVRSFDTACWSISSEWAAYVIFPLLLMPTLYAKVSIRCLSAAACVVILGALCILPTQFHGPGRSDALLDLVQPTLAIPVVRCLAEFALGLLAFRTSLTPVGQWVKLSKWIAPSALLVIIALLTIPKTDFAVVMLFPILIVSLASDLNVAGRVLASKPLEFVGTISYSIYLDHVFIHGAKIQLWITAAVTKAHLGHPEYYVTAFFFAITFPISYIAYRLIEKPGRRWLRRLFEPSRQETTRSSVAASAKT